MASLDEEYTVKAISYHHIHAHNSQLQDETNPSLWVVASGFVIDCGLFIKKHPGGVSKILTSKETSSFSFSSHFKHTNSSFEAACKRQQELGEPIEFEFCLSRSNGGLDVSGNVSGVTPVQPVGKIIIIGRFDTESCLIEKEII